MAGRGMTVPSHNYFLETARLGFRCWTHEDLPLALALWGDPEVTRLVGGPFNPEQVQEKLEREITNMDRRGIQYWPMFLLSNGEHVGCAGLRPHGDEPQALEMGYYLRKAWWRMGLAEEAGRAVVDFAFRQLAVKMLIAAHHPENASSQRVLEKLGFHRAGEKLYPPTGLMHPEYILEAKR
jgi:RimJ/RimL family protein N-acetyltransferase